MRSWRIGHGVRRSLASSHFFTHVGRSWRIGHGVRRSLASSHPFIHVGHKGWGPSHESSTAATCAPSASEDRQFFRRLRPPRPSGRAVQAGNGLCRWHWSAVGRRSEPFLRLATVARNDSERVWRSTSFAAIGFALVLRG